MPGDSGQPLSGLMNVDSYLQLNNVSYSHYSAKMDLVNAIDNLLFQLHADAKSVSRLCRKTLRGKNSVRPIIISNRGLVKMASDTSDVFSASCFLKWVTATHYLPTVIPLIWNSKVKLRKSTSAFAESSLLRVCAILFISFAMLPLPAFGFDTGSNTKPEQNNNVDYDYEDKREIYREYQKWIQQSMLGKGQKVGEKEPKLPENLPFPSEGNIPLPPGGNIHLSPEDHIALPSGQPITQPSEYGNHISKQNFHKTDKDKDSTPTPGHNYGQSLSSGVQAQPGPGKSETNTPQSVNNQDPEKKTSGTRETKKSSYHHPSQNLTISHRDYGHSDSDRISQKKPENETTSMFTERILVSPYSEKADRNADDDTEFSAAKTLDSSYSLGHQTTGNRSFIGEIRNAPKDQKPSIYIAGLFPWSEDIPAGAIGRGVLPAVDIALQHVNNDTRFNRKYTLKMASNDTRCDMAVATRAFFDMMAESQTTTAMLFGDVCYNVTGPMVQIAHQWGMFQLSYADTNPMLSDRDEFPNFYRTVPSDSEFNPARLALLRYFNWTTVGTLFQDAKLGEARHGYAHNRFDSLMEKQKINISIVESFADDPDAAIKNLKLQDARIIVGNFDQNMARRVFCSAHQHSMFGPKHQWIILGTYDDDWWKQNDASISCSVSELNDTLHGYLATDVLPLSTSDEVTESGETSAQYLKLYEDARGNAFSKYHGYAYDGVWVVAKALDRLLDDVPVTSSMFRGPLVGKVLNETNFLGVTGRVQFQHGDRVGSMTILQMQHGTMVKVGEYHALTDSLDLEGENSIMWRDGKPPVDKSIKIEELRHVSFPVYIGFVVMAALGITMAVLFLALNIRFRRHRYIKMSSPNMNNLIIVGCILCYLSIILLGADPDHKDPVLFSYWCTARSWTLALGFTLAFGAMFGKTWRVHAIFTNIKLNKKVIKDYKLMLIVLVLVLVDAVILVTWQVVDPFNKATKRLSSEVYEDLEIIPKIDYCTSSHMEIWLGALYAYKGLLLAFGCFLAWETRHVSIPALNDSKYIGMSVYNVVIMCVCGAAVSFIIEDRPTQSFIIIGLFIIFCTTITLCLVFLPKIIQLKRNPKGDEQRVRATLKSTGKKSAKSEYSIHKEKMRATSEENRRLRGFVEQKAVELENLLEQLGEDYIRENVGIKSALLHKKVLQLKHTDGSPGKLSVKSYSASETECVSTYSDNSVTTTVLMNDDSPPTSRFLKNRFNNSKLYSEAIEMAGVRFSGRKTSLTIPPCSEEENGEDDPFGGVYLGPSDSSGDEKSDRDNKPTEVSLGERQPLVVNSITTRPSNSTSAESVYDNTVGAQGTPPRLHIPRSLRLRRHSAPLAIWTIAESCLEDSPDAQHTKDTQPLVEGSPVSREIKIFPENAAMMSPMTPSPLENNVVQKYEQKNLLTGTTGMSTSSTNGPVASTSRSNNKVHFTCDVVEIL